MPQVPGLIKGLGVTFGTMVKTLFPDGAKNPVPRPAATGQITAAMSCSRSWGAVSGNVGRCRQGASAWVWIARPLEMSSMAGSFKGT